MGRRLRVLVVLAAVAAGCAVSIEQARRDAQSENARHRELAIARAHVDGEPFTPHQAPVRPVDGTPLPRSADVTLAGQDGEHVLIMPDGTLALITVDCVRGDACGCQVGVEYQFVRKPDGRVAVIRLRPRVHVRQVKVASCGYGCGQPAPTPEPVAHVLGVARADQVEIVDGTYDLELVEETCDHPIPRP